MDCGLDALDTRPENEFAGGDLCSPGRRGSGITGRYCGRLYFRHFSSGSAFFASGMNKTYGVRLILYWSRPAGLRYLLNPGSPPLLEV
jgi:hypothetical protein